MPMQDTQKSGNKPINVSGVPWQENRSAHGHGRRTKDEGRGAYLGYHGRTWHAMARPTQLMPFGSGGKEGGVVGVGLQLIKNTCTVNEFQTSRLSCLLQLH